LLISTRSRYGLRALVQIVKSSHSVPLSLSSIAREEEIPVRYLEQIFGKLRSGNIVTGHRGPGGGYVLSREASDISLLEVVKVLETDFFHTNCVLYCPDTSPQEENSSPGCSRENRCPTRRLWTDMKGLCESYLSKHTLADLANGSLDME
jgi:Rrf2 family iron-sulfur cluster assembly transcriptional regulator